MANYSLSEKIKAIQESGEVEYPKFRTLSEEENRSYYTPKDLPEYKKRDDLINSLKASTEQSLWENTKNAVIQDVANSFSFKDAEMAIGNAMVTEDWAPLVEEVPVMATQAAGAVLGTAVMPVVGTVAGAVVGEKVGRLAQAGFGVTELGRSDLMGAAEETYKEKTDALRVRYKKGEITPDEYQKGLEEAKAERDKLASSGREVLESAAIEILTGEDNKTKIQTLGQAWTKAAYDDIVYRAQALPETDAESFGAALGHGLTSSVEYLVVGMAGKALGQTVAKKRLEPLVEKGERAPETISRYAEKVGGETGRAVASTDMALDIMGQGAFSSVRKYIEDTGDVNLDYYTGDIKNVAMDWLNVRENLIIENNLGFGKLIKDPRAATKYGEWLNGFAQEFTQGVITDYYEWLKGNQDAIDILLNIPNNAIEGFVGGFWQGTAGTAFYTYYHTKNLNALTDVIMSQSTPENPINESDARAFADQKLKELETGIAVDMTKDVLEFTDATKYQGKIYDTIRDNLTKTIDAQREIMKDTLDGSMFDDLTETELAQYIESVAQDMTDRAVIDSLEKNIAISESPLLRGETIDGTYYLEGLLKGQKQAEAERAEIREAVYAAQESAEDAKKMAEKLKERKRRYEIETPEDYVPTEKQKKQSEDVVKAVREELEKDGVDINKATEMASKHGATYITVARKGMPSPVVVRFGHTQVGEKHDGQTINANYNVATMSPEEILADVRKLLKTPSKIPTNKTTNVNVGFEEQKPVFQEEYDDLTTTKSVQSVIRKLQALKAGQAERMLYDTENNNWYLADADEILHRDMFVKAFEQGNYPEFNNEREAQQFFDENYEADEQRLLSFLVQKFDTPKITKTVMERTIGGDEYKHAYLRDNTVIYARYEGDLEDSGFPTESFDHYKVDYDETDNKQVVLANKATIQNLNFQNRQRGKGGAYDARTRSITLGAKANVTTLPHELAHYWIDKNFKWARSGKASTAWLRQWQAVEKWLGIDPEDKYLSATASEKFARAYERFLGEEQLPLVLKKSMADFRDFVLDHYDYELDDAKGLQDRLGRPIKLNDDVKEWFRKSLYTEYVSPAEQAIVNERLGMDNYEYNQVKPEINEQKEIETTAQNSVEINEVAPTGMDIQKGADVSNDVILGKKTIGGGEVKESKGKIAQALGKTYESTNWDVQEELVESYLSKVSVDEALDALDNETYPDKIDVNFLRQALVEKLLAEGREMEAAALIEETADDFTESAQKLQAARRINTPFTNAIRMLTIGKAMRLAEARYGKNKDAVKSLDAAINALITKYEQDYANAQTDEERELVFAAMQDEAVRTIGSLDKSEKGALDFQEVDDKEERKQAKAIRKRQIRRASIKAYRSRAKRVLKQALGLEPTREQVREIKKLTSGVSKAISQYRKGVRENKASAIDPTSILTAQNALNEYMNQQLPPRVLSNVSDALNSYMMANMLWNPATNVFNVWSTWVQMVPHMLGTYINYGKGTIPWKEKMALVKQALALQAKTGYNIFSLRDFFDKKTLWAEKYYEPKTKVGKVQAFPLTMLGLADTANKGIVFLQRADAMATKQAKEEGAGEERAKELFYQALNTDPRTITVDGIKIRESAVKEGEEATFTQMSRTAELVNKFRKLLNFGKSTGIGTVIMPFTTTISNIAEDTVKNYALGSVRELVNAPKAIAAQFDKTATAEMKKEAWKDIAPETKNVIKNMIGVLMLLGIALKASDDEDYVLGYERQTEMDKDIRQNRNAPSGYAIRIGNKWVDLDLFGIGSPWAKAYLIAKRDGFTPDGWVKGIASNIDLVPGVAEIQEMYDRYSQLKTWSGDWEALSDLGSDKFADVVERLIPAQALFNEIGNIEDTSKRVWWDKWYDRAISKIPGLRRMLPERTSKQTGKVIPQTDDVFNLISGQRIKEYIAPTSADTARYEFALSGKALAYREGNSKLKELGKDSEEYNKAISRVRQIFTADLERVAKTKEYKAADIDEKRKIANKLHTAALEIVKAEYGLSNKKTLKKKQR